ncbi:MAG: hypothetical protein IT267_09310 [Saprospiraceae bacterium]|nr:hypothetical protein [Saprospiraceae bacterium]
MKIKQILLLILTFSFCSVRSQGTSEYLIENNKLIRYWYDSLEYFQNIYLDKKITDTEFQIATNRIASELSNIVGYSLGATYSLVDSVLSAGMTEGDISDFQNSQTDSSYHQFNHPNDSMYNDISTEDHSPDIKMPLSAKIASAIVSGSEKRTKFGMSLSFGFTSGNYLNGNLSPSYPLFNNFYCQNWGIVNFKTRLGGQKSKLGLVYGISLDFLSLKQTKDFKALNLINDKPVFSDAVPISGKFKSIKLKMNYLRIPLGLNFKFFKNWDIQVNGFYNILLTQKQIYKVDDGEISSKTTIKQNLGMNKNLIGMNYQIGTKRFFIFAEHSLNSILNSNSDKSFNYFKFGIGLR